MTRAPLILVLATVAGLTGCPGDESYIIVTVESRPAVHDPATLKITLSNGSSSETQDFGVKGKSFPATFSILPTGRTGDLGIAVDALDDDGLVIGRGSTQSMVELPTAKLMLETTDFVVNTEYAEDQQLSNYYDTAGFQLSATADGAWTAVYTANCNTPCNVFGRRYDAAAKPLNSTVAAGTAGFPISSKLTTSFSTPAVATNGTSTITVWNHHEPSPGTAYSIECRALDANGAAASGQLLVSADEFPNLVSIAAIGTGGNFVATWDGRVTNKIIRTAIIKPDCTVVGAAQTVSQGATTTLPGRSHVAANATGILHAWVLDGAVHARAATPTGVFSGNDTEIIPARATETIEFVRVAPLGTGFAVIVRWVQTTGTTGPGRIELYRLSAGAVMGAPILVTDRSGTDFASSESFGVAGSSSGVLVVWHSCNERGDGSGCGVFGRLMGPSGAPAGAEFVLATTTTNDQTGPSAVALSGGAFAAAWTDLSGVAPDSSGTSVRARVIYPTADTGAN